MFPDWTIVIGFWLGAVAGSFLNVVIYRLPRAIPLGNPPHSFCPSCRQRLGVAALIPLVSWAMARGKCVYCGAKVPARYFWVELATAALWTLLWKIYFVDANPYMDHSAWIAGCAYSLAAAALVAIIWIDWELFIIPDEINAFLLVLGIGYGAVTGNVVGALWGALAGWGLLFGIAFFGRIAFRKDAMGHGDIKMMRGIGALLGAKLVVADTMIAVVLGLVVSILLMGLQGLRSKPVPAGAQGAGDSDEDAPAHVPEDPEEEPYEPESIRDLLVLGVSYLLCLDIVALFWKGLYPKLGFQPEPENVEEDDWVPTATTIPFGPYLAAGALACMLFMAPILAKWDAYFGQFR